MCDIQKTSCTRKRKYTIFYNLIIQIISINLQVECRKVQTDNTNNKKEIKWLTKFQKTALPAEHASTSALQMQSQKAISTKLIRICALIAELALTHALWAQLLRPNNPGQDQSNDEGG